ncbi:hypothetical protein GCM10007242_25250 [Pigmentiphaga litoralis]|jgi:hypothetical protein|uniref:DUF2946 family protein n=1 Tax=Pigmentiphaga litoralis TaxID=516702 RepID=UPI0016764AF0|nr:DUF2946 family protein [Pigmentiphaga litoralis]GGX17480.1 hypothetical protein GCM10007242_25250 [Pigmentiphaga litoralis]
MHALRTFRFLHLTVLLWFAMTLGAAIASPIIKPALFDVICSGSGVVKIIVHDQDSSSAGDGDRMVMDCPLCFAPVGLMPTPVLVAQTSDPLAYVLKSIPAARLAAATLAPLPARGPPSLT